MTKIPDSTYRPIFMCLVLSRPRLFNSILVGVLAVFIKPQSLAIHEVPLLAQSRSSKIKGACTFYSFISTGVRWFRGDSDFTFDMATTQRMPATWRVSFNIASLAFNSGKIAATAFSPSSTALLRPLISVAGMP